MSQAVGTMGFQPKETTMANPNAALYEEILEDF